jgi:hypothetical protein
MPQQQQQQQQMYAEPTRSVHMPAPRDADRRSPTSHYQQQQQQQQYAETRHSPPFRPTANKRGYLNANHSSLTSTAAPVAQKTVEVALKTVSKGASLSTSMDALQSKMDDLRVTCGTMRAIVSTESNDVHVDADQLVHCVDICDY